MLPIPRSASVPPARSRRRVWGEPPPSAEQLARCASIRLLFVMSETAPFRSTPACRTMERFRMCEVPKRCVLLPQDGLVDAISPDQVFTAAGAAGFSCDGGMAGTLEQHRSFNQAVEQ